MMAECNVLKDVIFAMVDVVLHVKKGNGKTEFGALYICNSRPSSNQGEDRSLH